MLDKSQIAKAEKVILDKPPLEIKDTRPSAIEFATAAEGRLFFVTSEKKVYFRAGNKTYTITATEV